MSFVDRPWARHAAWGAVGGMLALVIQAVLAPTVLGGLPWSKLPDTTLSRSLIVAVATFFNVLLVPGSAIALVLVGALGGVAGAAQQVVACIINALVFGTSAVAIGGRLVRVRAWRISVASFWALWLAFAMLVSIAGVLVKPD